MLTIKAYAKINLGLDVLGRRPDGYHEVKMVMQTVDIADELSFERIAGGIVIETDCNELPVSEDNLIYKAAKLLMERYKIEEGVKIMLIKKIPIAAGMAGGSTDAAAVFHGLNELFNLNIAEEELCHMGKTLGADIPFCISGGTVLAQGIGEKLTRLKPAPQCVLLVAKPDVNVSTKYVYEHLDALSDYTHPDIDGMADALEENDLEGVVKRLGNVLESVTVDEYPIVDKIRKTMLKSGAKGSIMSGSGPTVFGIFDSGEQAKEAGDKIRNGGLAKQIFVTGFVESSWRRVDGNKL